MHSTSIQPLAAEHIALVQASFARVEPVAYLAAALFYERLFELEPTARQLFTANPASQRRKLMLMLGTVAGVLAGLATTASSARTAWRPLMGPSPVARATGVLLRARLWSEQ